LANTYHLLFAEDLRIRFLILNFYVYPGTRKSRSESKTAETELFKSNIFTPKNWDFLAEKPPKNSTTGVLSNIQLPKGSVT